MAKKKPAPSTLAVEDWPIEKVKPYEQNPRRNHDAVAEVVRSITRFGWRQPIVVDEAGVIIVGHTRLLAAKEMELETVPVHVAKDMSPEDARAYRIMDNKSGETAEWDEELLFQELEGLKEALDDWQGSTGFTADEFADIEAAVAAKKKPDPEKDPDAPIEEAAEGFTEDHRMELQLMSGYRTAIHRSEMSGPMKWFRKKKLLEGDVLDYGCGMDAHDLPRFDPAHYPDQALLAQRWDVVTCIYVLNVIPLEHNRVEALFTLMGLLKEDGYALVAVSNRPNDTENIGKMGYRSGWTKTAWTDFLSRFSTVSVLKGTPGFWGWKLKAPGSSKS